MSTKSTIKGRVMTLSDALGIGHKKLIEEIGMTYSNFTGRAKETPLNSNAIAKILASHPQVNAHWLLTGDGEMFKNSVSNYPLSEKNEKKVSDCQGVYEVIAPAATLQSEVPAWLIEEHRLHGETVLSQQRTIEKLVDRLKN